MQTRAEAEEMPNVMPSDLGAGEWNTPRILVTGCTGYVGSHLLPILRTHLPGARLFGTSRGQPSESLNIHLDQHITLDLTCESQARSVIAAVQPDVTIHLASPRAGSLEQMLTLHVLGTATLLHAMRDFAGPQARTIVVGSAAEIGFCRPEDLPLSESAVCRPIDDYGVAKQAQSLLAQSVGLRCQQQVLRVRLFNLLGPGLPTSLLPGRCVHLLAQNARIPHSAPLVFGNLSAQRDYVDVRDACEALALAARRGQPGRLYHVGTGRMLRGSEIVQGLMAVAEPRTGRLTLEESEAEAPAVPMQQADARLAAQELGWQPRMTVQQSFEAMWQQALREVEVSQEGRCG